VYSLGLPRPIIKIHPQKKWAWPGLGGSQIFGIPFIISATCKASNFQILYAACICQSPSQKQTQWKSGRGRRLGELPKFWGSPLLFLQRLKLATSNLLCSLGLPCPIIKITPKGKSGRGPKLGELPNILWFPFIISASADASDFKFGVQLGVYQGPSQKHTQKTGLG